jgi:dTDP-4-amino-4,6-dideoxygalactose transaminase
VPFNNLTAVNSIINMSKIFEKVWHSGRYILSENVEKFEKEFAEFCGVKYCVGVNSGTDALILSLKAIGIREKDFVITSPLTAPAVVSAIYMAGGEPIFVEIDRYGLLDYSSFEEICKRFGKRAIRAVIPIHLYGKICDMERINSIAKKYDIKVIEDASHSHGAKIGNRKAGSFGDIGAFSFYPTKPLGAMGDGGAIVTNDRDIYEYVRRLRNYGLISSDEYPYKQKGYNSRLDEIQAAILLAKLPYVEKWNEERRNLVKHYIKKLKENNIRTIYEENDINESHACHLFPIVVENREIVKENLLKRGIETKIRYYSYNRIFPYKFLNHILCLPLWNGMTIDKIDYIVQNLKEVLCGL